MARISKTKREEALKNNEPLQAAVTRVGEAAAASYLEANASVLEEYEKQKSALIHGRPGPVPEDDQLREYRKAQQKYDAVIAGSEEARTAAEEDVVNRYIQITEIAAAEDELAESAAEADPTADAE